MNRVGFITNAFLKPDGSLFDGGAERQLYQLARFAYDLGVEPVVYQPGPCPLREFEGILIRSLGPLSTRLTRYGHRRAVSDGCQFVHHQYLPRPWKVRSDVPTSATQFGIFWDVPYEPLARDWYPMPSVSRVALPFWRRFEIWSALESVRRLGLVLVDDTGMLRLVQAHRPHLRDRVHVALNFCDLLEPGLYPSDPPCIGALEEMDEAHQRGQIVILVPRNISLVRGIWWLPIIAEKLMAVVSDSFIFVVTGVLVPYYGGADRYERALNEALARCCPRVRAAIKIVGGVPHSRMVSVYQHSDVVLIPSFAHEGSSLAAIEAMTLGCPVVATNIGGLNDVLDDRSSGLLVSPTVDSIVNGLAEVIGRPALRESLGRQAQAKAQACFTLDKWRQRVRPFIEASGWLN